MRKIATSNLFMAPVLAYIRASPARTHVYSMLTRGTCRCRCRCHIPRYMVSYVIKHVYIYAKAKVTHLLHTGKQGVRDNRAYPYKYL